MFVKILVKILSFIETSIIKKQRNLKRNKGEKNKTRKQTSEQTNKQKTNKETKQKKANNQTSNVACFFFRSDAMAGDIACGQTIQIKRQQASNHANQHKLINFTCRNRPCSTKSKSHPRFADVVVWFGRPQRWGCVFN